MRCAYARIAHLLPSALFCRIIMKRYSKKNREAIRGLQLSTEVFHQEKEILAAGASLSSAETETLHLYMALLAG